MAWSKSHPGERCLVEVPVAAQGLQPQRRSWGLTQGWHSRPNTTLKNSLFFLRQTGVVALGWVVGSVPAG